LDGVLVGVFGTDQEAKLKFETSVAKKSEAEGLTVFHRVEGGRRLSFLDVGDFPERIQGYSRVASIADHALYFFPKSGRLTPPDGELAVLMGAFGIGGTLVLLDGSVTPEQATLALKGTPVSQYPVEERSSASSVLDPGRYSARPGLPSKGTMVYVDRVFTVKGVGTVALGFVLSGSVSVHDSLRPVPGPQGAAADVKGIQVNDVDFDAAGRGIRVGLSLRGVEPKDLERTRWLDDGSFRTAEVGEFEFRKSPFYRQEVESRDLHIQLPGEIIPARLQKGPGGNLEARFPFPVPLWDGMAGAVIDLNGKNLRVAGGATCKF
jgi:selenocysteine-specific translation elongation factor